MKTQLINFLFAFASLAFCVNLNADPINNSIINDCSVMTENFEAYSYKERLMISFANETVEMIGFFAHPTSTYVKHKTSVYDDVAYITITLEDTSGEWSDLKVKTWVNGADLIGGFKVIHDEDWFPPFLATSILKEAIDDFLQEHGSDSDVQRAKSLTSQILDRTYYQWDGGDMCLFMLNTVWLSEDYYNRY